MNVLVVEDRADAREKLVERIKRENNNINITAVTGYTDLMIKILSESFDSAIVDIDLKKWDDFAPQQKKFCEQELNIQTGRGIADMLKELTELSSPARIVMYSADVKHLQSGDQHYSILEKGFAKDFASKFRKHIMTKIISAGERPLPTFARFNSFGQPQKICYYKKFLSRIKVRNRFEHVGDFYWSSNFQEDGRLLVGEPVESTSPSSGLRVTDYSYLEGYMKSKEQIPNIVWNFKDRDFLRKQYEHFAGTQNHDATLETFFNISFSRHMADAILAEKQAPVKQRSLIELLRRMGSMCITETQNNIIKTMSDDDMSEAHIRTVVDEIGQGTGYEAIDLFTGTLTQFDKESDRAWIRLRSKINPENTLTKMVSYKNLVCDGVEYKDADFLYSITREKLKSAVSGTIEPLEI